MLLVDDSAGDVGQALVAAVVEIRQRFVVHAEQMQDRCVEVVDRDRVFLRSQADGVGGSVVGSAFRAGSGEPD